MWFTHPHRIGNERPRVLNNEAELAGYFAGELVDTIRYSIYMSLNVEEGEEHHPTIDLWIDNIIEVMYAILIEFGEVEFISSTSTVCRYNPTHSDPHIRITKEQ